MSNSSSSGGSFGVSIFGLLTVAFVILKLCHVIDWSWWWILSPLWIPIAIYIVILIVWYSIKAYIKSKYRM